MQETYFLYSTNSVQIQSSSNIDECPPENILHPSKTIYWMSEESLPQILIFDLTQMKNRPPICRGFGLYCQHISEQKPKIIEVFISKNKKPFISLGKFENDYNTQLQVYTTEEILFTDVTYIKLEIKETFGGYSTYITNFYLYEHLPEVDNSSKIIHSREMNLPYSGNSQREIILSESDVSGVGKGGNIKSSSTLDEHHTNRSTNNNNNNNNHINKNMHQRHHDDEDDRNIHIISEDDRKEMFTSNERNYNFNYNSNNTLGTNNNDQNINKYLITNTETNSNINNLLHSSDHHNMNNNNNNMNIINTKTRDEDMVLLTEGKNLENSTKEYIDTLDTRINNLESGLTNLNSKFNFITSKFDTMLNYNQTQPQLTYNHLISECNKMIDNKIQHYLRTAPQVQVQGYQQESLNTSGMSNNERDIKERKLKFEEMLNRKIEEKFSVFTNELKERIFNSMLKPAMEHLNKHLERDLKEIRKQIKEVEIHNQKNKRRYSYRVEGNSNRNHHKQDKRNDNNNKKHFHKNRHYHNYKEEDEHELLIQTSNESRQSHNQHTPRPPHHHHHSHRHNIK